MKPEHSTEYTKDGKLLVLEKYPIVALLIDEDQQYTRVCQKYNKFITKKVCETLNKKKKGLKLTEQDTFTKVACCNGKDVSLPKHLDNNGYNPDDLRKVTAILYFGDDWKPEYGGILRIHLNKGSKEYIDIEPKGNRLVLFWSDMMIHQVLPTTKEFEGKKRFTLTIWISTTDKRNIHEDETLLRKICQKHFTQK